MLPLFCFSLLEVGFQSCRLNFYTNNSLEKILTLTQRREKILVVAAVRFMRAVIGIKVRILGDFCIVRV
jgi:protein phosphatase 4 regulatory subunit 3